MFFSKVNNLLLCSLLLCNRLQSSIRMLPSSRYELSSLFVICPPMVVLSMSEHTALRASVAQRVGSVTVSGNSLESVCGCRVGLMLEQQLVSVFF